jgi:superfamily II DNA or RNA helicase
MMGIAQKVAREFAEGVRVRGQSYFDEGKVTISSARPGEAVAARVTGSESTPYKVRLRMRPGRLHASCSCPYFGPEGEPCKHLWATLLAVDAAGLLHAAPVRPLRLVPDVRRVAPGPNGQAHAAPDAPAAAPEAPADEAPRLAPEPPSMLAPAEPDPAPPRRGGGFGFGLFEPEPEPEPAPQPSGVPITTPELLAEELLIPRSVPTPPTGPRPYPSGPAAGRLPHGTGPMPPTGPRGHGARPHPPSRKARGQDGRRPNHQNQRGYPRGPAQGYGRPTGPGGTPTGYPAGPAPGYGPGPGPGPARGFGRAPGTPPGRPGAGPGHPGGRHDKRARAQGASKRAEPKPKPSLLYVLDAPATLAQNQVVITLARRAPRRPGAGPEPKGHKKKRWQMQRAEPWRIEPEDRLLLALLDENRFDYDPSAPSTAVATPAVPGGRPGPLPKRFVLKTEAQAQLVERLCRTGRCRLRRTADEMNPPALRWDDGRPWRFVIDAKLADAQAKRWTWRGALRRDDDRMDLAEPLVLLPGLVILGTGRAARFDDGGIFAWMLRLRHEREMLLLEPQQDTMLGRILGEARVPPAELVEGLELHEVDLPPVPRLSVRAPMQARGVDMLIAELEFDYDGARVASFPPGRMAVQTDRRRVIRRDVRAETRAKERLADLGFRPINDYRFDPGTMEVSPKRVPGAARELVAEGWRVEAEGVLYRPASDFKLDVTSGMDWFELDGRVSFGGQDVSLPEVLAAARRGDTMITLGDGSIGMLPEDWLRTYGLLADLGTATEDGTLRFSKTQAGLLDALLAEQAGSRADADFTRVRQELRAFEGVEALDAPAGFQGELRPYQREGLGWLEYLRRFGFGGILADDMGLGKTVQLLALLQRLRSKKQLKGPSLIIVPRSLVFNWMQEAARFTPRLRVLDYTGPNRHALRDEFDKYDLIVTTYGTLRSDVAELRGIEFEYAILDEAQAIKNADSQSAKAARLLRARHRLAMSGTPIENHLGELWSIFEFLNPGMLGTANVFKRAAGGISGQDEQARKMLAKALRPFILRRTKQQVVEDLPEKIEQTLYCDLEPAQRKLYDDLLAHYRRTLLRKDAEELRTSKIEVLEALLRLRQAACHPGLIDPARAPEPSAKLDMLLPQVAEVVDEGHKVLVFSQFTSFLAIVRQRLDEEGLTYEYLDGRTRNRQERVERFQNDPDCPIFLISLKAGGLGLNLTAAEYVYLLDPWWNPAVEAQAIDRSHRIGQTNTVFAYRLICRDTVEQKILDLQQKKRDLADAILNADNRLIQALTRDDLEFLLS